MQQLDIIEADFENEDHAEAILAITDVYARDPMGLKRPLSDEVKAVLLRELYHFPGSISFIAMLNNKAVGLANCFYGFSTFKAQKVLNIHDLAVLPEVRGKGVGEALLSAVEKKAVETDCCKVTLEVREDNRARNLYERSGFEYGEPRMFFMTKELD
jgi:GNAT superfamily N-acetyltransferase